jgi:segregation and condensation protein B
MSVSELPALKNIVEAALLAAGRPLSLEAMQGLFGEIECPDKKSLRTALAELAEDYQGRGIEIAEVASGWRIQVRRDCSAWVSRLWDERPPRYSRALMETLALIAYRQPITRGEIEDIRGVSVSTNIINTLKEREWVHVVGHRDVPGKPSLYGTTREFLDYFGLKSLDELPTLAELRDLDEINRELDLNDPDREGAEEVGQSDTEAEEDVSGDGPRATGRGPEESDQASADEGKGLREKVGGSDVEPVAEAAGPRPLAPGPAEAGEAGDEGTEQLAEASPGPRPAAPGPAEAGGAGDEGTEQIAEASPGPAGERAEGLGPRAEEEERSSAETVEDVSGDVGEAHTESVSADDVEDLGPREPGEPREP